MKIKIKEFNVELEVWPHMHDASWGFSYSGKCDNTEISVVLTNLRGVYYTNKVDLLCAAQFMLRQWKITRNRPHLEKRINRPRITKRKD